MMKMVSLFVLGAIQRFISDMAKRPLRMIGFVFCLKRGRWLIYTNESNIIDTVIALLERNSLQINTLVQQYQPSRNLKVFKGMRQVLPADAYPSLEIEPTTGSNQWATTRAQRPRYHMNMTLTTVTDNEKLHVEYICTVTRLIVAILTSPENLQLTVLNESRWSPNGGLVSTVITDSFVEDVTYNAVKEGTIRTAEFPWWALIHEPYPDFKFRGGESSKPTILRPRVVTC